MSWLSSFSPIDSRNRAPTPEFPVNVTYDIPPDPAGPGPGSRNTTPRLPRAHTQDAIRTVRGRSSTPDRGSPQSPIILPYNINMQTIPPSPRSGRKVKVIPDSPRVLRNRPPSPDESVLQDLSWLQHHSIWSERQGIAEQPIFTTKAHVFQIDPDTKKNWIPACQSAASVSYYYDSTRNTYRIISVDGSKAIINSTISPGMTFTKTSQKFGQWSDPRANTVYGLGFSSESELTKFIEKFKEVKEMTRQQLAQNSQVNGSVGDGDHPTPQGTPQQGRQFLHTRSSSLSAMQGQEMRDQVNLRERRNSFNTPGSNNGTQPANSADGQLKYENDRLKLALAQSSANAKKWEVELQTLKNNNARLTAALQESTANVEEWKKQLAAYKEESGRMKKKMVEMEKHQSSSEQVAALQGELAQLTERLERVQLDNQDKQDEINQLSTRVNDMTAKETASSSLQGRINKLEEENQSLILKIEDQQRQLQELKMSRDQEDSDLLHLQDQVGNKVQELYELHEHIISLVRKESQS